MVSGTFGLFLWERMHNESIEHARTVAVNTIVMFEIFYLFNSRQIENSIFNMQSFFANRFVFLAVIILLLFQIAFTYLGAMQTLFQTVAIELRHWLWIVLISFSVLPLVEIEKFCIRTFKPNKLN